MKLQRFRPRAVPRVCLLLIALLSPSSRRFVTSFTPSPHVYPSSADHHTQSPDPLQSSPLHDWEQQQQRHHYTYPSSSAYDHDNDDDIPYVQAVFCASRSTKDDYYRLKSAHPDEQQQHVSW